MEAAPARRNFFDAYSEEAPEVKQDAPLAPVPKDDAVSFDYIRESVIGHDDAFDGPFGTRRLVYADYTASGRALSFLEDYISNEVLPLYANSHTLMSRTGIQTTLFREEARQIIMRCVNASIDDVAIFTGSGATGAANAFVGILGLAARTAAGERVVVLVGPYEHHSNILPWREAGCEVRLLPEDARAGGVDLAALEAQLRELSSAAGSSAADSAGAAPALVIGSFSAGSNVTGILTDPNPVTELLHRYQALSVWDFAGAGPYVDINMNPKMDSGERNTYALDAVFISPHKFVGGVGTPGLLVMKKRLCKGRTPNAPGGGTVFFVTEEDHRYLQNIAEREEGGTPNIVGAIRCGLVFQLKEAVTSLRILNREHEFATRALKAWTAEPRIAILGNPGASAHSRLPIFSFLIRYHEEEEAGPEQQQQQQQQQQQGGFYLASNFVCALLNDLFGIQSRSGCLCAGPYSQRLLGLDSKRSAEFEDALLQKNEIVRPGFVRVNLSYFAHEAEVQHIIDAVLFVARHGWKFLPQYRFYLESGEWKHVRNMTKFPERRWLGLVQYGPEGMRYRSGRKRLGLEALPESLRQAEALVAEIEAGGRSLPAPGCGDDHDGFLPLEARRLRWFALPTEAVERLRNGGKHTDFSSARGLFCPFKLTAVANAAQTVLGEAPAQHPKTVEHAGSVLRVGDALPEVPRPRRAEDEHKHSGACCPPGGKRAAADGELKPEKPSKLQKQAASNSSSSSASSHSASSASSEELVDDGTCKNCFHVHRRAPEGSAAGGSRLECLSCDCVDHKPWVRSQNRKRLMYSIQKKLMRGVGSAIRDFGMIKEGDRILVAVSGGKDSLTLVHILKALQRKAPVKFEIGACTVDPQTPEYDPSILKSYFKSLGIPYFYESQGILKEAMSCSLNGSRVSICAYCARMKRGVLYSACRREGYNVLAMGQHLDDLAESFLMSIWHNGSLRTMKANYFNDDGDLRIIRPLTYVRESLLREFAKESELPVIAENCPACFEAPKERKRVKSVLAAQEHIHPTLFNSMLKAMTPLIGLDNASNRTLGGASVVEALIQENKKQSSQKMVVDIEE